MNCILCKANLTKGRVNHIVDLGESNNLRCLSVRPSKVVSYNGCEARLERFNQPLVVSLGGM